MPSHNRLNPRIILGYDRETLCQSNDNDYLRYMKSSAVSLGQRHETLERLRNVKMARSAHSYVRGNTVRFYEWLECGAGKALPAGPDVWICGDCHLGNLGPVANAEGAIDVQIRDLDQTVIGSPAHDLVRLGLSLAMAARGSDLPGVTTASILEEMVQGYVLGLISPQRKEKPETSKPIKKVLAEATRRRWKHLATERIEDVEPRIPLGKRFWALSKEERSSIEELFTKKETSDLITCLRGRDSDSKVKVLDAAYWVKGCSSLGRLRYAVLLGVGKREYCLIDVKEAPPAAAPKSVKAKMPRNNAERVVEGARSLSPFLGQRMMSAQMLGTSVVVRELMPQDLKLEMGRITQADAVAASRYLASVVGRAHGRQIGARERRDWRDQILNRTSKDLEAPSWLWRSVVELVSSHEVAYLEHCRRCVSVA
jgi:uncharacterized protein (DUF2252 family)